MIVGCVGVSAVGDLSLLNKLAILILQWHTQGVGYQILGSPDCILQLNYIWTLTLPQIILRATTIEALLGEISEYERQTNTHYPKYTLYSPKLILLSCCHISLTLFLSTYESPKP